MLSSEDALRKVLTENGLSAGSSFHGWRRNYPNHYRKLVSDLQALIDSRLEAAAVAIEADGGERVPHLSIERLQALMDAAGLVRGLKGAS